MNDRLKFRFWHKPTQKMIDCYGFNEEFVFGDVLDGIGTEYNPAKFEDCILMQCTGLKDKNGALIYEGDILSDAKHKYIIEWSLNGGYFVRKPWIEPLFTYRIDKETTKNTEVIGNIYENKELLDE